MFTKNQVVEFDYTDVNGRNSFGRRGRVDACGTHYVTLELMEGDPSHDGQPGVYRQFIMNNVRPLTTA